MSLILESAQNSAKGTLRQGDNEGTGTPQDSMEYYIVVFKEEATTQDG